MPPNRRDTLASPQPFVRVRHPDDSPSQDDNDDYEDDESDVDDADLSALTSSKEFSELLQSHVLQQQLLQTQRLQRMHMAQQHRGQTSEHQQSSGRSQRPQHHEPQQFTQRKQQQQQHRRRQNEYECVEYEDEEEDSDHEHDGIEREARHGRLRDSDPPNLFQESTDGTASSQSASRPRKYNKTKTKSVVKTVATAATTDGITPGVTPPKRQYKKTILRQQAALLAAQIKDENEMRDMEATRRILARADVVKHLQSLRSLLTYAHYKVEQGLEEQPLHMVAELFEESLEESSSSDGDHVVVSAFRPIPAVPTPPVSSTQSTTFGATTHSGKSLVIACGRHNVGFSPTPIALASNSRARIKAYSEEQDHHTDWEEQDRRLIAPRSSFSQKASPSKPQTNSQVHNLSDDSELDGAVIKGRDKPLASRLPSEIDPNAMALTQEELHHQQKLQLEELQKKQLEQLKELQKMQEEQQLALQKAHTQMAARQRSTAGVETVRNGPRPQGKSLLGKKPQDADKENQCPSSSTVSSEKGGRPRQYDTQRELLEQQRHQPERRPLSNPPQDRDKLRLQLKHQEYRQRQQQKLQQNQQKEQELLRRQRQLEQQQLQQQKRKQLLLQLQQQQLQEQKNQERHPRDTQRPPEERQLPQRRRSPSSTASRSQSAANGTARPPSATSSAMVSTPKKKKPLNPVQKAPSTENILASVGATARKHNIMRSTLAPTAASPALLTAKSVLLGSKRIHSSFEDKENFVSPSSSPLRRERSIAAYEIADSISGRSPVLTKVYKKQRPTSVATMSPVLPASRSMTNAIIPTLAVGDSRTDPMSVLIRGTAAVAPSPSPSGHPTLVHTISASSDFAAALASSSPTVTPILAVDTSGTLEDTQNSKDLMNCFDQWMSDLGSEDTGGFAFNQVSLQPAFDFAAVALGIGERSSIVTQSGTVDDVGPGSFSGLDDETELDESEIDHLLYSEVGDDYGGGVYGDHGQECVGTPGSDIGTQDLGNDAATADLYDWFPEGMQGTPPSSFGIDVATPASITEQHLSLLSTDPTLSSSPAELAQNLELGLEFDAPGDPLWLQQELRLQKQQQLQQQHHLGQQEQELLHIEDLSSSRSGTPQLDSTTSTLLSSSSFSDMLSPATMLAHSHSPSNHYIPMGLGGQPVANSMPGVGFAVADGDFAEHQNSKHDVDASSVECFFAV
ncbi:hypothetical protein BGZ58_007606 [Dissophora ornata]|nr:hypothetical protein BGZ58_007606 [Dissophora ornata]